MGRARQEEEEEEQGDDGGEGLPHDADAGVAGWASARHPPPRRKAR